MRDDPMKARALSIALGLLLALGALVPAFADAQGPPPAPPAASATAPAGPSPGVSQALEPKAIEVLKASSQRLAAARTMSFTAVASYESPSRLGPALVYTTADFVV